MIVRIFIFLSLFYADDISAQLQLDSRQVEDIINTIGTTTLNKFDTRSVYLISDLNDLDTPKNNSILFSHSSKDAYIYQPRHFGMFCRIESKIERKSGISPRFRLGSSEYVDMLEGKKLNNERH
jgi:hypothetical protein